MSFSFYSREIFQNRKRFFEFVITRETLSTIQRRQRLISVVSPKLSVKMPANTEMHTEEVHSEHSCKNGEESKNKTAAKNSGFFCDERGYLEQIEFILQHGRRKGDRTGTGVVSVFGSQARYSLRGSLHLVPINHVFT